MTSELDGIFARYEMLRSEADTLFNHVSHAFPQCVSCNNGCSDCCHALFDLSLVEAMYVHKAFEAAFGYGSVRSTILQRASDVDRSATRLKRDLFREEKDGENLDTIMEHAAQLRLRCPLLDEQNRCLLYDARPITCRVYGVPTAIAGHGHVCGLSHFEKGVAYPTIYMDKIQDRLQELSREIVEVLHSRFNELHTVYVPLSMALLTHYDDVYLGVAPAKKEDPWR
ncbi:MAG: YkgJ family cysteine cluster protein [Desulfovibrio sp.]|nr:YkgJ family cysteine cluster protein [Desulfovibrio sp.]